MIEAIQDRVQMFWSWLGAASKHYTDPDMSYLSCFQTLYIGAVEINMATYDVLYMPSTPFHLDCMNSGVE